MNKIRKIILLLLAPILISSYEYQEAAFSPSAPPEISSCWEIHPVVKVCKDLKISKSRVEKALDYWRRLGYTFEGVIYDDQSISCAGKPFFGEIVITIPDQGFDYDKIAITRRTINEDMGMIIYSKIFLQQNKVTKERVLEHELGHALGWNHTTIRYHMMNKGWENGGHNSSGLGLKRYQELYELIKLNRQ